MGFEFNAPLLNYQPVCYDESEDGIRDIRFRPALRPRKETCGYLPATF